jgi:hypothetical protein
MCYLPEFQASLHPGTFAIALFNCKELIPKERPFGLTQAAGNHGQDVKELYYCDSISSPLLTEASLRRSPGLG